MSFAFFIDRRIESGSRFMLQKSVLDRIRDSLATTGADLQEEVKRQYSHECGHIGMAGVNGLITGDGIAIADQVLRETKAMNGWSSMDVVAQCETVKRSFYLAWRKALGLKGEPDTRPFGERCCGFARAMGELIPGFPSEDSFVNPPSEEGVAAREDGAPDRARRSASAFSGSGSVAKENSMKQRDANLPFKVHNDHIRIVSVAPIPTDYESFVKAMEGLGFRRNVLWGNSLMTLAGNEFVACETLIPGAGANTDTVLQRTVCHALRNLGVTGQVEISVSARMYYLGPRETPRTTATEGDVGGGGAERMNIARNRDPAPEQRSELTRGLRQEAAHRQRSEGERPDYFVAVPSSEDAVLRRIKGNFRRQMISKSIRDEGLASIPELWCAHDIPESFKEVLTSTAGPRARGGEDLPDLAENEVEVARLTLADSVHGEVTSLRAKRDPQDGSILLSMVDEYETEFKLPNAKISAPLTAEEVLAIFRDADPTPLATSCQVEFSSFFYPNLDFLASEERAQQRETASKPERTPASDESARPLATDLDFDKMTPVVADAELPDGFVRVIMPNGKCFDILEELWAEARRIEPGCVIMSRKATGTKQN